MTSATTKIKDPIIRAYIKQLVGDEGLTVVEKMPSEEVTDEKIAEITGVSLNVVRRTLYILYENHLAKYRRVRDKESGWLTYLWTLDISNIDFVLEDEMKKLLRNLKRYLEFEESNVFYVCSGDPPCGRYSFDIAAKYNFSCPNCEAKLVFQDNAKIVEGIKERISQLEKAIT
ncbi:MAG: transcription factor [Methanocellales archaeon]